MSRLDIYAKATQIRHDAFMDCLRVSGRFKIGPTSKGGIFLHFNGKDISSDLSTKELREMRDIIDDFLKIVVGEDS